jgi:hypothetical protein
LGSLGDKKLINEKTSSKVVFLTGANIAYIYPDFKTALVGKFENGIMVRSAIMHAHCHSTYSL